MGIYELEAKISRCRDAIYSELVQLRKQKSLELKRLTLRSTLRALRVLVNLFADVCRENEKLSVQCRICPLRCGRGCLLHIVPRVLTMVIDAVNIREDGNKPSSRAVLLATRGIIERFIKEEEEV